MATYATNGKCFQRAGIGPEASGENNDVEVEFVLGSTQAGLGDFDNGLAVLDINQLHVVPVKGFHVPMVQRRALGKQRVFAYIWC